MILKPTMTILGGDTRQISLAARLAAWGLPVRAYGLPQEKLPPDVSFFSDWREAVCGTDAVILPLPVSPDGVRISLPLAPQDECIRIDRLFSIVPQNALLMGGRFSPAVKAMAEEKGLLLFDYFKSEELQQKNALPTAEGAVSILMREIPRTVSGLSVGVTGFGRVARALIKLLLAMDAKVTVAARKYSDIKAAAALGCDTVHLVNGSSLSLLCRKTDVIFNTVPHWIFSADILAAMPKQSLIIDLASAPGGVDAAAATAHGIRVIWALSLPGKYAPVTAGEIIADTLLSYMREEGRL
jgi:dipicolinate synthase subunit A